MTIEEFRESAARRIQEQADRDWPHVDKVPIPNMLAGKVNGMRMAAEIVRSHPVASPWIAVGERLPEPDGADLLIAWDGEWIEGGYVRLFPGDEPMWFPLGSTPTHWMKRPEPPEPTP